MFMAILANLDYSNYAVWLGLAAGLVCALVVFWIGRGWVKRQEVPILAPMAHLADRTSVIIWKMFHRQAPSSRLDPFVKGGYSERRRSVRREGNPVVVCLADLDTNKILCKGYVVDRSTGGLGLMLPKEIAGGTIVLVRSEASGDVFPWVQLEIRHCRVTEEEGRWFAGCQFTRPLAWSVLFQFG